MVSLFKRRGNTRHYRCLRNSFCFFFLQILHPLDCYKEAKKSIGEARKGIGRADFRSAHNPTLVRYRQVQENALSRTSIHSLIHSPIYFFSSSILSRSFCLLTASIYTHSRNRILLRLL
jgi:hypothetical protein